MEHAVHPTTRSVISTVANRAQVFDARAKKFESAAGNATAGGTQRRPHHRRYHAPRGSGSLDRMYHAVHPASRFVLEDLRRKAPAEAELRRAKLRQRRAGTARARSLAQRAARVFTIPPSRADARKPQPGSANELHHRHHSLFMAVKRHARHEQRAHSEKGRSAAWSMRFIGPRGA
jgi:hypothetical protein